MRTIECKLGSITIGKFEIYRDEGGQYSYKLKDSDGEIIAISEGYSSEESCMVMVQRHVGKVTGRALIKMRQSAGMSA
jgi:VCBS repeat-containing protein